LNTVTEDAVQDEVAVKLKVRQLAEGIAGYARKIGLKQSPVEVNGFSYRLSFGNRDLVVAYRSGEEKPSYHLVFGEKVHLKKVDIRPLPFAMLGDAIDALKEMKEHLEQIEAESKSRAQEWLKKLDGVKAPE
jgi:hypothetical protein